jgi:hypothetical protein
MPSATVAHPSEQQQAPSRAPALVLTVTLTAKQAAIVERTAALMRTSSEQAVLAATMFAANSTFDSRTVMRDAFLEALNYAERDAYKLSPLKDCLAVADEFKVEAAKS